MRSLQVTCFVAGMLALSASTLPAQAGRMSCKDGTLPKAGHFSCWGHGGIVAGPAKLAATPAAKAGPKSTTKSTTKSTAKSTARSAKKKGAGPKAHKRASGTKPHRTVANADKKPR